MKHKDKADINFIRNLENDANDYVNAKFRFPKILTIINKFNIIPESILDVGGNCITTQWLKAHFPNSSITIQNISKETIESAKKIDGIKILESDFQYYNSITKYDFIYAGEMLHCIYNPDRFLVSVLEALTPNGYLLISDLNLAMIYNVVFLLFGWSPLNYSPSLLHPVGNPFHKTRKTPQLNEHKSTFTWKGLLELLELYNFKILHTDGYSYGDPELEYPRPQDRDKKINKMQFGKLRILLNHITPKSKREGMIFLCQRPRILNMDLITKVKNY